MTLLLPVDGCGECVAEESSVVAHPYRVEITGPTGLRAWYRCPRCHYSWWTSWHISALDVPCPGCMACAPVSGAA